MPIPATIDFDRVAHKALTQLSAAVRGWLKGQPLEEGALLNRVTEAFGRGGKTDYGLNVPVRIDKQLYLLHRKGANQTDLFGADLAITVDFRGAQLVKTVLIQLKGSAAHRVQLERRQLEDARAFTPGWPNSFVMAVDRNRGGVRLTAASQVLLEFAGEQSRTLDASTWASAVEWIHAWLSCELGAASDPRSPNSIEANLATYLPASNRFPYDRGRNETVAPDGIIPARTWLYLAFVPFETGRSF